MNEWVLLFEIVCVAVQSVALCWAVNRLLSVSREYWRLLIDAKTMRVLNDPESATNKVLQKTFNRSNKR